MRRRTTRAGMLPPSRSGHSAPSETLLLPIPRRSCVRVWTARQPTPSSFARPRHRYHRGVQATPIVVSSLLSHLSSLISHLSSLISHLSVGVSLISHRRVEAEPHGIAPPC